jgi:hypothetical protein
MSRVTWIRRGFEYGIILLAVVIVLLVTGCATTQYVGNGQVDPLKMTLMTCKSQAVAYLGAADNVLGPLVSCLSRINQPGLRTRNAFSTLLPSLLADI